MRRALISILATLRLVGASPLVSDSPECSAVYGTVHKASAYSTVKPFCSSYLHIPPRTTTIRPTVTPKAAKTTVTSTVTGTDVTIVDTSVTTVTATSVTTSVQTPDPTTTTFSSTSTTVINCFDTDTTTLTAYSVSTDPFQKRDVATTSTLPVPSVFSTYGSSMLSAACSCYKPYSVSTVTVTKPTTLPKSTSTSTVTTATTPVTTTTSVSTTTTTSISTVVITTTTPTSTTTEFYIQPTPGGTGMLYAAYYNPTDYDGETSGFDPSQFQQQSPTYGSGIQFELNNVGSSDASDGFCSMDDGSIVFCGSTAIVFQGFFYAATTGQYAFYTPNSIDNELMFFHGDIAYGTGETWSASNCDYNALRAGNPGGYTDGTAYINLNAGQILPVTVIFGNSSPQSSLQIYVQPPGSFYLDYTGGYFTPQCQDGNGAFSP